MYTSFNSVANRVLLAMLALSLFTLVVPTVSAMSVPSCKFTRDLQMGMTGEDVRCLQQYLNATGYIISWL
jgi:peptidoglycan hydrolase-like protein with peptidoglycan-binding domain